MQKAFYIIILQLSVLIGSPNIHPMVKSMLIPGWGEAELGHQKKSRFFFHSETILVTSCLSAYKMARVKENEYRAYANEHAGAKKISDHRYWVDIGNYISNHSFDEEHLRMRDGKEGQWSSYPWYWEGGAIFRKRFESMRIDSAGNVGIGTNAPTAPLTIEANGSHIHLDTPSSGQNNWITWKDNGSEKWEVNKDTSHNFNVYSYQASANLMQFLAAGTTLEFPTANFLISGSATTTGSFGGLQINNDTLERLKIQFSKELKINELQTYFPVLSLFFELAVLMESVLMLDNILGKKLYYIYLNDFLKIL